MCIFALRTYLKNPWMRNAKDTTALSGGFFISVPKHPTNTHSSPSKSPNPKTANKVNPKCYHFRPNCDIL